MLWVLAGCGGSGTSIAPTSSRHVPPKWSSPGTPIKNKARTSNQYEHTVKKGDTLYSIAWQHGLDYRVLGRWNGIKPPYLIHSGQKLVLKPKQPHSGSRRSKSIPKSTRQTRTYSKSRRKKSETKKRKNDKKQKTRWRWPVNGRLISTFSARDPGRHGIKIAGKPGQAVVAAASGRVVYAGSGLRGYGMLIIVKHDENFLSAYAHNRKLLVKEATKVRAGQRIAEMGQTGTNRVMLHFEIRHNGKPVNPLYYLPGH